MNHVKNSTSKTSEHAWPNIQTYRLLRYTLGKLKVGCDVNVRCHVFCHVIFCANIFTIMLEYFPSAKTICDETFVACEDYSLYSRSHLAVP